MPPPDEGVRLAPGGETRRVTSEPVTVAVTAKHIQAAEAFWTAAKD